MANPGSKLSRMAAIAKRRRYAYTAAVASDGRWEGVEKDFRVAERKKDACALMAESNRIPEPVNGGAGVAGIDAAAALLILSPLSGRTQRLAVSQA